MTNGTRHDLRLNPDLVPRRRGATTALVWVSLLPAWMAVSGGAAGSEIEQAWEEAQAAIETLAAEVMAELAGQERPERKSPGADSFDLVTRTHALYGRLVTLDLRETAMGATATVEPALVRRDRASIRPRPDSTVPRFAQAAKGSRVYVLGARGDWRRVLFLNGTLGWMRAETLTVRRTPRRAGRVEAFVRAALKHRGIRYLWGGASVRGVDCSGLVYRLLRSFGLHPPRTAAAQYRLGTPVPRNSLRPGDLLFFRNTYKPGISHVGIYLGGNRFLHASSGRGNVTVGSLRDPYYVAHYAGAKRLFRETAGGALASNPGGR